MGRLGGAHKTMFRVHYRKLVDDCGSSRDSLSFVPESLSYCCCQCGHTQQLKNHVIRSTMHPNKKHTHRYRNSTAYESTKRIQEGIKIDTVEHYTTWPHPADKILIKEKSSDQTYKVDIYTDGSKGDSGVGSGVAIFIDQELVHELQYKLHRRCSNNQAEQYAILKALEQLEILQQLNDVRKSAAIHTDSRITLDSLRNFNNHHHLIEHIRKQIRKLETLNWTVHFAWVKAHVGLAGNELADHLAKAGSKTTRYQ
ncbi:hypothetical protein ANN_15423 [Periplaneta americana]|uniref:ribonuclease H n=1 Tax=Periplaneta americana TaxID=6978 RepID=A0ABQ8SGC5_PERAM|nr:hypothetical protein ANN_15423 [Periplaneta americana]